MSVSSWVWLFGIVVGVFLLGYQTPSFLGNNAESGLLQAEREKRQDAEDALDEVRATNIQLTSSVAGLESELEQHNSSLAACIAERDFANDQAGTLRTQLRSCSEKLDGRTVDLWYIHQGDGRGYPEGNNSEVHNFDDRPNWNSRRFRSEICPQHRGPRIDETYAESLCGGKNAVGPIGVLSVGGGTCGHGVYVIGCMD